MLLYDYFRSTASYRVRIALNLKGIKYDKQTVNLMTDEHQNDYLTVNPQGLVPALELNDGTVLTQSLAICEYLEETYPKPAILPGDPRQRAFCRSLSQSITCDIHPLNNLRVRQYLQGTLNINDDEKLAWYHHWVEQGLAAFESALNRREQNLFCCGETPTLADICLIPQIYNARRFECDISHFSNISRIVSQCESLYAFFSAYPSSVAI